MLNGERCVSLIVMRIVKETNAINLMENVLRDALINTELITAQKNAQ